MKILILGHTGFVGKNLLIKLQKVKDVEVSGISKSDSVDIVNYEEFSEVLKDTDPKIIINCAAHFGNVHYGIKNTATIANDNMQIGLNIYKAVLQYTPNALIVNLLANCSYPSGLKIQKESDWWNGMPDETALSFGATRKMIYVLSKAYKDQYDISSFNLVIPGLYGPGDHLNEDRTHALDGIILRLVKAKMEEANQFHIWGTGTPIREWLYVDDLIEILFRIIKSRMESIDPINLAQNKGYSINEIVRIVAQSIDFYPEIIHDLSKVDGAPKKVLCNKRFREVFPNYKFKSLTAGIKETVKYYSDSLSSNSIKIMDS